MVIHTKNKRSTDCAQNKEENRKRNKDEQSYIFRFHCRVEPKCACGTQFEYRCSKSAANIPKSSSY